MAPPVTVSLGVRCSRAWCDFTSLYVDAEQPISNNERKFYAERPFVRVVEKPPHSKWAMGTNLAFVSYAADAARGVVIALGAIDNLGKGAAGQAVQNANLMCGLEETAGLEGAPIWP